MGAEGSAQSCGFTARCAAVSEITELGMCLTAQPLRRLTHGLHSCMKGEQQGVFIFSSKTYGSR